MLNFNQLCNLLQRNCFIIKKKTETEQVFLGDQLEVSIKRR